MVDVAAHSQVNGFYVAYFSGVAGNSLAMFVFKDGAIAGADTGGGRYDGEYLLANDQKYIEAKVRLTIPAGNFSITGIAAESEPISVNVPVRLPIDLNSDDVHRIETPIGPVNAKFEKIRSV